MVFGPILDAELATWQARLQSKNNHRLVSHIFWNSEDLIAVRVKLIFDLAAYAAHFRLPWSFLHCAKLVPFRVCYKTGSLRQSNFRILDFKAYVTEIFNRRSYQISSKWCVNFNIQIPNFYLSIWSTFRARQIPIVRSAKPSKGYVSLNSCQVMSFPG